MKFVSQLKILFFIVSLSCISEIAHSKPWPPEVDIYLIRFNYTSGYTDDALAIRKNASTSIPLNEWLPSSNRNNPFAYIKNQASRKIQVIFYVEDEDYRYIAVHTTTSGDAGIGDVDVSFSVPWYEDEYWLKTITLSGSVPSSVGNREFTWSWYLDGIGDIDLEEPLYFASTGSHKHYTLYAAPQPPMGTPWSDVLDYSAEWAEGESSGTGVAGSITDGIYTDLGDTDGDLDYDTNEQYTDPQEDWGYFDLDSFLYDIANSSSVKVNCVDVSNLFNIFSASLGLSTEYRHIANVSAPVGFYIIDIDPIGSPDWIDESTWWGYHQHGWYNSKVFDPCLMVDEADPTLPTNMSQTTYEAYLLDVGSSINSRFEGTTTLK